MLAMTQDKSHLPKPIKPFTTYNDVRDKLNSDSVNEQIIVEFVIDESGDVIEPNIIDTFNLTLNDVILDKVRQMEFSPPIMNGHPKKLDISYRYYLDEDFEWGLYFMPTFIFMY